MKQVKISILLLLAPLALVGCSDTIKHEPLRPKVESESTSTENNYNTPFLINGQKIFVEIVSSKENKQLGLSGRISLENNQGMLFDSFDSQNTRPGFWMKDMLFPIDIIWIKNNVVVDISKSVPVPKDNSDLPIYYPQTNIDSVLEVQSGFCDKYNAVVGSKLERL